MDKDFKLNSKSNDFISQAVSEFEENTEIYKKAFISHVDPAGHENCIYCGFSPDKMKAFLKAKLQEQQEHYDIDVQNIIQKDIL